jgi:alpha-galactosidase
VSWDEIGLPAAGKALVRDLWPRADVGSPASRFQARVAPHDVVMVRITPQP